MAFVRKIVIVLVGVALALLVTVLLLNPVSISTFAANLSETSALVRLPLAILLDVLLLGLIVVLVRSERVPRSTTGLMVKAQGAIADVSIESARDRILRAVRDVPDVLSADATLRAIRGKADVELEVVVSHESNNLPEKQRELDRALRQVINKQLGLQMAGKPRVHIRMDDEKLEALPPVTPLPPPAPAAEPVAVPEPINEAPAASEAEIVPVTASDTPEATAVPQDDLPPDDRDLPALG